MAQYWIPPSGRPAQIAPSLINYKRGVGTDTTAIPEGLLPAKSGPPYPYPTKGEEGNPTVVPKELLANFHFTFLIRHPKHSIPSYYRCTIPPLDAVTGFYKFRPDEAGYDELRRLFDYLREIKLVGPQFAQQTHGEHTNGVSDGEGGVEICVIDADDLLDNPSGVVEAFCKSTGIKYEPEMLKWESDYHHDYAKAAFEKWKGFHDDAINSTELKARAHVSQPFSRIFLTCLVGLFPIFHKLYAHIADFDQKKNPKSDEQLFAEWTEKYGEEGAKVIRDTVAANVADYEYLKQFAIKVSGPNNS
jgi:hypothetical protein